MKFVKKFSVFVTLFILFNFSSIFAQESKLIKLKAIADTYICSYPNGQRSLTVKNSEQGANAGASKRLKLKKNENNILLKFDFSKIPADQAISKGTLSLQILDKKEFRHVGVGTLHVAWVEGKGTWDDDGKPDTSHKGACFFGPSGVKSQWIKGQASDFTDVFAGQAGSRYKTLLAKIDDKGLLTLDIPTDILELCRVNGQTLVLSDDTGIFSGDLDNAFVLSRESDKNQPELLIETIKQADKTKPAFTSELKLKEGPFPGSIIIELPGAGDDEKEGLALYYQVLVNDKVLDWHLVPNPFRKFRSILLQNYLPDQKLNIEVKAFDEAGNDTKISGIIKATGKTVIKLNKAMPLPKVTLEPVQGNDQYTLKLVNGSTLFNPVDGKIFPHQTRKTPGAPLRLFNAVKGEIIGLQAILQLTKASAINDIQIKCSDLKNGGSSISKKQIELFREHYVLKDKQWIPDVLPSIDEKTLLSLPSQTEIEGQKSLGVFIDIIIPKDTKPGLYKGTIEANSKTGKVVYPYSVWVRDVNMPDKLSFIVEMNAYGHSSNKEVFHETYRMLHKHRLSYNVLGYSQTRPIGFTTPKLNNAKDSSIKGKEVKIVDWKNYDNFYGPIFSGEIAKDLPRKNQPASHWYLPFHESWPIHLKENHPSLWKNRVASKKDPEGYLKWRNNLAQNDLFVKDHFTKDWRDASISVATQFKDHFKKNGWTKTSMQVFCNNKYYFATGSASLWTMDEPMYARDYKALNFVYAFFRKHLEGVDLNLINRGDISRPQYVCSRMDESLDYLVVSSALRLYANLVSEWRILYGKELWWYGGGTSTEGDPLHYIALFLDRWKLGCEGGMPQYTTFAGSNDWSKPGRLRVVRFDPMTKMPVGSFRMKAYRRGQQDIELLNLLQKTKGWNIWQFRNFIDTQYSTKSTTKSLNPDDPGTSVFEDLLITKYNDLRERVIATLLNK
ncbi:MAG: hypothetical protein COA79_04290 [Planctomycetota bacterium]|nr:MAG: hypothetical protein COA79_04290 [Planctomycetota bacterium]